MLTQGTAFVERGQDYYERAHEARVLKSLERRARQLGYSLTKTDPAALTTAVAG
jgi:hypothetical protein